MLQGCPSSIGDCCHSVDSTGLGFRENSIIIIQFKDLKGSALNMDHCRSLITRGFDCGTQSCQAEILCLQIV